MHLPAGQEYGLRCLLQVSADPDRRALSIAEIAEAEGLTPEYTAKLMRRLRLSRLVDSVRGPGGGYRLTRPADEITVWEALAALGGDPFPERFCERHTGRNPCCVHRSACALRGLWGRVREALRAELSAVTLRDLAPAPGRADPASQPGAARRPQPRRGLTAALQESR